MSTVETPSMEVWQQAWANSDAERLGRQYADDGLVLPPNHLPLKGPAAILAFFSGGFASIEVRFFPERTVIADTLAYETGIVRDLTRATGTVVEVCDYAVTWERRDDAWQICCHTWSVPHAGGDDGA